MRGAIILLLLIILITGCAAKETTKQTIQDKKMKLTTDAFQNGDMIPKKYTCQGEDISPHLKWEDAPENTKSFALILDDPDAPSGTWVHWLIKDIPKDAREIKEDSVPGTEVDNSWGRPNYGGPCPPSGVHRYIFRLFALDVETFDVIGKEDFYKRVEQYKIEESVLLGRYTKD